MKRSLKLPRCRKKDNTPALNDKDVTTLATLHEIMEAEREELKHFKWKP